MWLYKDNKCCLPMGQTVSNIVCGVRGGVGPVWTEKHPRNAKVSQDFCPWLSDLSVTSKSDFHVSTSQNEDYSEINK